MNLNQATVASRDVARAAAFYEALGLEPIVRAYPRYARLACPGGGAATVRRRTDAALSGPARRRGAGPLIQKQ